jgi:hypothetical protein
MYPKEVWEDVWSRNGNPVFRHFHNMNYTWPRFFGGLAQSGGNELLLRDEFFEVRENKTIGKKIRAVKPILQFPGGEVELKYNVGTRSNGIDAAKWPHDLMSEVVI